LKVLDGESTFNLKSDIIKADPIIYAENREHHANEEFKFP
jgi:hypothetical protein